MATMWTPPIDLYDEARDEQTPDRDDREMGFALPPEVPSPETRPPANGDVDDGAVSAGEERWGSVLGW